VAVTRLKVAPSPEYATHREQKRSNTSVPESRFSQLRQMETPFSTVTMENHPEMLQTERFFGLFGRLSVILFYSYVGTDNESDDQEG